MEHNLCDVVDGGNEEPEQQQQMIPSLSSQRPPVPPLCEGEVYHVFISYSSSDRRWTHGLIDWLESRDLKVCYHDRDFIPGHSILENMSACIQESQKVLLVLSPEFVRSRWCLLEANMTLFRDCLECKPILPVLLEPGVSVPLHLCHLTYLEAGDPDFHSKLLKVLCTPNQQLQGSSGVFFQPPSIYNGKALQPLSAVNEEGIHMWEAGQFSDMGVPDQLRCVIKDQETYSTAIRTINRVSQTKVWMQSLWLRVLIYFLGFVFASLIFAVFFALAIISHILVIFVFLTVPLGISLSICLWAKDDEKYMMREMQKAVGQANILLLQEKILLGCCSNTKLHVVYVSTDSCKREFANTFDDRSCAEDMFQRALLYFSSGYTCCLAKRHFPFPQPSSNGHLEAGVCFCQYVSQQLSRGEWS